MSWRRSATGALLSMAVQIEGVRLIDNERVGEWRVGRARGAERSAKSSIGDS